MKRHLSRAPGSLGAGIVVGVIVVSGLLGCSRAVERPPGPGGVLEPMPAVPPEEVRTLPEWVMYPHLHPRHPSTEVIGAVGRSPLGPVDAENHALDALVDAMVLRVEAARERARPLHPYFAYEGEFAETVARRLEPSSLLVAGVLGTARVDSTTRIVHDDVNYAFAYIDRATALDALAERGDRMAHRVDEAVDIAMNAADVDNWFGFVRWSRSALTREAERVATLILRDALGEPVPMDSFAPVRRLEWVSVVADTLTAHHGFTLHTAFEWDEPPPPQMEVRIQRHLMSLLRAHGLRAGFGTGCPQVVPKPVTAWPDVVLEPAAGDTAKADSLAEEDAEEVEEEPEPAPHHVLEVRASGSVMRTALASWDARVMMTIEARTCEAGTMIPERPLGELEGLDGRDAFAAYLRALDWERLDAALLARMREIDLLPPAELVEEAPAALRAF